MNPVRKFLLKLLSRGEPITATNPDSIFFSQFGQDIVLSRALMYRKQDAGFYVDIGAHHPNYLSNTYYFYSRGWRGINIEANPLLYQAFLTERPRDINLSCGIASVDGKMDFYRGELGYEASGTFSKEQAKSMSNVGIPWTKTEVPTLKMSTMFEKHLPKNQSIDFMTIDCEGYDLEVLQSNNWQKYRPCYLVIEDTDTNRETPISLFCESVGYPMIGWYGSTKIFKDSNISQSNL